MSLVDRLNSWIVGRVRQDGAVTAGPDGLGWTAGGERRLVAWRDVHKVVALTFGTGLEASPGLVFEVRDGGGTIEVNAGTPGWAELTEALGGHLALSAAPASWQARLAADEGAAIILFDRASGRE